MCVHVYVFVCVCGMLLVPFLWRTLTNTSINRKTFSIVNCSKQILRTLVKMCLYIHKNCHQNISKMNPAIYQKDHTSSGTYTRDANQSMEYMTLTKGMIKTTSSSQYMQKKHLSKLNNDYDLKNLSSKLVLSCFSHI